jgi:hypothetical protein
VPRSGGEPIEARGGSQDELAFLEALSAPIARRRLVIVPVGRVDLRATKPANYVSRIPAAERRAVHVTLDEARLWELAEAWMSRGTPLPLQIVENAGGVAPTLARVVEFELAAGFDEVLVVVGRMGLGGRRQHPWHDRTADDIARVVGANPRALVGLMTVAAP